MRGGVLALSLELRGHLESLLLVAALDSQLALGVDEPLFELEGSILRRLESSARLFHADVSGCDVGLGDVDLALEPQPQLAVHVGRNLRAPRRLEFPGEPGNLLEGSLELRFNKRHPRLRG